MDIKGTIERHGFTQTELSEKMGITKGTLSYSINHGTPSITQLRKMADAMGIHITEFFEDEIETPNNLPDMNKEVPAFAGEITMNGKRYGLVEIE